ncbi:MAG: nucleotide-binding protein [Planctomycetaceae bacterium]|nr:nucleotide-binding protein [Planctomycetaceae bacterium]
MDLSRRDRQPEVMDQPDLDVSLHRQALDVIGRFHRLFRSGDEIFGRIRDLQDSDRPLRILDVACGGGDMIVGLGQAARKANFDIEISGCDLSNVALERTAELATQAHIEVKLFPFDAIKDEFPEQFDVIVSTMFIHHLSNQDVVALLRKMKSAATKRIIVADQARSRATYFFVKTLMLVASRSPVTRVDGPLSIRAAFTADEFEQVAREAGLENFTMTTSFVMKCDLPPE